jgi:hypothetical protein
MPETPGELAKRMLKELKFPQRLTTQATLEEFVDLLRACAKNKEMKDMDKMLDWIVNKRFSLMLRSILSLDRTLLNKLFDPNWTPGGNNSNDLITTKEAIDGLDKLIYKKRKGANNDAYTLPVVLEMSKDDYDKIVSRHFFAADYNNRYFTDLNIFGDFLEVKHIPRLLQMMSGCFNLEMFTFAWNIVDEQHWSMLSEFIWEKLYDGQNLQKCGKLEVSNPIQLRIAQFVVEKSSSRLEEYNNVFQ